MNNRSTVRLFEVEVKRGGRIERSSSRNVEVFYGMYGSCMNKEFNWYIIVVEEFYEF